MDTLVIFCKWVEKLNHQLVNDILGMAPSTRIITCLVENPYK